MRFQFSISHVPGKNLTTADALSRAPSSEPLEGDKVLQDEADVYVNMVVKALPATERRINQIQQHQEKDEVCRQIAVYCYQGWPKEKVISHILRPYLSVAGELTIENNLLMRGSRIVIPSSLRKDVLNKIHAGHQGITKCRERTRQSVWWPGISKELEELVNRCHVCCKTQSQRAEPLITTPLPDLPWQKVATDIFEWKKSNYLLIVDYYSRFIEVARLRCMTADEVILHTKSVFARHGIPEEVISDNGPQFSSKLFQLFSHEYGFHHITSCPLYPQSNGEAERAVKTIKALLNKASDPSMALLAYRSTPLQCGFSPAELLMSRKLRTTLPLVRKERIPKVPDIKVVQQDDNEVKTKQKKNFNSHHGVYELPELYPGDTVWIKDRQAEGKVIEEIAPRSYVVHTPEGEFRRNRRHLIQLPKESDDKNGEIVISGDKSTGTEEKEKYAENHAIEEEQDDTDETQIENITPTVEEELTEDHRELEAEQHVPPRATGVQTRSGRWSRPPDRYGW